MPRRGLLLGCLTALLCAAPAVAETPSIKISGLPSAVHLNAYGHGENFPVTVSGETGPGGVAPYYFFIYGGSTPTPCSANIQEQGFVRESFVDAIGFEIHGPYSEIEPTGGPIDIPGTYYFCAYLQNGSVPQTTPPVAFAQKTFKVLPHEFLHRSLGVGKHKKAKHKHHRRAKRKHRS
jgi:hypothetical protein